MWKQRKERGTGVQTEIWEFQGGGRATYAKGVLEVYLFTRPGFRLSEGKTGVKMGHALKRLFGASKCICDIRSGIHTPDYPARVSFYAKVPKPSDDVMEKVIKTVEDNVVEALLQRWNAKDNHFEGFYAWDEFSPKEKQEMYHYFAGYTQSAMGSRWKWV